MCSVILLLFKADMNNAIKLTNIFSYCIVFYAYGLPKCRQKINVKPETILLSHN